jgi:hypothetical protein
MNEPADRRRFWRAAFHAEAQLVDASGVTPATLLDISLRGALLRLPSSWHGRVGTAAQLELRLADDAQVSMAVVVCHVEGPRVGLRCEAIDLDSVTHLRRLVELNAGDPALLDRELAALLG